MTATAEYWQWVCFSVVCWLLDENKQLTHALWVSTHIGKVAHKCESTGNGGLFQFIAYREFGKDYRKACALHTQQSFLPIVCRASWEQIMNVYGAMHPQCASLRLSASYSSCRKQRQAESSRSFSPLFMCLRLQQLPASRDR